MARITNKGNLSGAVGNLVFVQNGKNQYVRSKPGKVKQSAATKKAASLFGWVSSRDKVFRRVVLEQFSLLTDSRYAARHRARMKKTLGSSIPNPISLADWSFQNPEALMGFDFNEDLPWEKSTQFYPEITLDETGNVHVRIPALHWGKEIKALKKTNSALLKLEAFVIDPNTENMEITPISTLSLPISEGQHQEAINWDFILPNNSQWVMVIAILSFDRGDSTLSLLERTSTSYLWAKNSTSI